MIQLTYVTATIYNFNDMTGYRLINTVTGVAYTIPVDKVELVSKDANAMSCIYNAEYDEKFKGWVGKNGFSLTKLPKLRNGKINGKNCLVVLSVIMKDGEVVGCRVSDCKGFIKNIKIENLYKLCKSMTPINFKLVTKNGKIIPESTDGTVFDVLTLEDSLGSNSYNSGFNEEVANFHGVKQKAVYSLEEVVASDMNKNIQDKMLSAVLSLKRLSAYYWLMLDSIDKKPCDSSITPTLGVSENTFYYNPDFVNTIDVPQLLFIFIHELNHIGMRHVTRCGKRDRNLWNIATDLYINEIILREFDLQYGQMSEVNGQKIMAPEDGLYMAKMGEVIDLAKDIPEVIYNRLSNEAPQQEQGNQGGQGSGSGQGNQDGQGQGSGQGSQGGQGSGSGQGSQDGQDGQDSDSGQGSQGQGGAQGSNQESEGSPLDKYNEGNDDNSTGGSNGGGIQSVTYNGKKVEGKTFETMVSETGTATDEQRQASSELSKQKLSNMNTKIKLAEQKSGKSLSHTTSGTELLQRFIDFGLGNDVDWRTVLKNLCKYKPKKQYTLAYPNQDYMNMGVTIADRRKVGKKPSMFGIKICVDVSGSIDDATLNWYLSEVANIFTYYDVSGELIYWSTQVGDCCDFKTVRDLAQAQPLSTGGTDVSCIFKFLLGDEKSMSGKVENSKPKDILAVIILTDGCFSDNYAEYKDLFGKKVLFIIDGNIMFNPLIGKSVMLKGKDD